MHVFMIEYFHPYFKKYTHEYYKDFDKASDRYKQLLAEVKDQEYMPEISNIFVNI